MAEDYALTSIAEIKKLQKELEELKKNPLGATSSGRDLMESLDHVSENLGDMLELFKEASEQMKLEEREEQILVKKIGPILDKLDAIEDQNKKIAEGIVAVADMVEEISGKVEGAPKGPEPKPSMMPGPEPRPIAPPLSMAPSGPAAEEQPTPPLRGPTAPPVPTMGPGPSEPGGLGALPSLQPPELPGQPIRPAPSMPPPPGGAPPPPPPSPALVSPKPAPKKKGLLDIFTK